MNISKAENLLRNSGQVENMMGNYVTPIVNSSVDEYIPLNSTLKISNKILDIISEVGYVAKNGNNSFQKYKYATESDIVSAIRKAMIQHRVLITPTVLEKESKTYTTRGGKQAFLVSVKVLMTFTDVESGEHFSTIGYGEGSDSDDKGVYKAITGAQKYILLKTFMIETGDDPEKDVYKPIPSQKFNHLLYFLSNSQLDKYYNAMEITEGKYFLSEAQQKTIDKSYKEAVKRIELEKNKEITKTIPLEETTQNNNNVTEL